MTFPTFEDTFVTRVQKNITRKFGAFSNVYVI